MAKKSEEQLEIDRLTEIYKGLPPKRPGCGSGATPCGKICRIMARLSYLPREIRNHMSGSARQAGSIRRRTKVTSQLSSS